MTIAILGAPVREHTVLLDPVFPDIMYLSPMYVNGRMCEAKSAMVATVTIKSREFLSTNQVVVQATPCPTR